MVSLQLNPLERVILIPILLGIKTGNYYIYDLIENALRQCSLTQEELDKLGIKKDEGKNGNLIFPPESMKETKEIAMVPVLIEKIKAVIKALNEKDRPMEQVVQEASLVKKIYPDLAEELNRGTEATPKGE